MTVRAFAGLRELVGDRATMDAGSVAELLDQLTREHGEEFARRMARSRVVVGDQPVSPDDDEPLPEGTEVVLLPPFAGGA